jgi:hypothetical protein
VSKEYTALASCQAETAIDVYYFLSK